MLLKNRVIVNRDDRVDHIPLYNITLPNLPVWSPSGIKIVFILPQKEAKTGVEGTETAEAAEHGAESESSSDDEALSRRGSVLPKEKKAKAAGKKKAKGKAKYGGGSTFFKHKQHDYV